MDTETSDPDRNVRLVVQMLMAATETDAVALALILGVARRSLYERLSGGRRFSVRDLARMSKHFGVDPGVFFAGPRDLLRAATVPNRDTVGYLSWAGQGASPPPVKAA